MGWLYFRLSYVSTRVYCFSSYKYWTHERCAPVGQTRAQADIGTYNGLLTQADGLGNKIGDGETSLNEDSARVLLSAQGKFGRDSNEVEQLGGTRKSERAKPAAKAKTQAPK